MYYFRTNVILLFWWMFLSLHHLDQHQKSISFVMATDSGKTTDDTYVPTEYLDQEEEKTTLSSFSASSSISTCFDFDGTNNTMNQNNQYQSNQCEMSNIVLFDGICNLCNTWVDIILRLDKRKQFRFCPLQSTMGRALLQHIGRDPDDMSTIVLLKSLTSQEAYFKSKAVLKVIEQLAWPLRIISFLGTIVMLLSPTFSNLSSSLSSHPFLDCFFSLIR